MRRADRLFQIINLLRQHRHAVTAKQLAETLQVSERTIYRDIQSLSLSNVPVDGEAGVGYRLHRKYDLPPLMFGTNEVEALLFGARMVQAWSDRELAASASLAMQKILAVLPEHLKPLQSDRRLLVPDIDSRYRAYSEEVRSAISDQKKLKLDYQDEQGQRTDRLVQPLSLVFWGKSWTLVAWCELRDDYRMFRLDRILTLAETDQHFQPSADKNIDHYLSFYTDCDEL